jgi:hypothetical protein
MRKNDAQEKARYDVPDILVRRGGGENGGRLYGREHDKDYADDHEDDRTPQKSYALVRKLEAHRAHDKGVRETRPSGEGDEASVRGRMTCGDQQENTECHVKAQHHVVAISFRRIGMP